jgi:hypothetical protein
MFRADAQRVACCNNSLRSPESPANRSHAEQSETEQDERGRFRRCGSALRRCREKERIQIRRFVKRSNDLTGVIDAVHLAELRAWESDCSESTIIIHETFELSTSRHEVAASDCAS